VTLLVAGCANASRTYGPDGREAYTLNCCGWARSWGMCLQKAGELCQGRGYKILVQGSDRGTMATWGSSGGSVMPLIGREMMIQCGE
jgi:hypothetical protein